MPERLRRGAVRLSRGRGGGSSPRKRRESRWPGPTATPPSWSGTPRPGMPVPPALSWAPPGSPVIPACERSFSADAVPTAPTPCQRRRHCANSADTVPTAPTLCQRRRHRAKIRTWIRILVPITSHGSSGVFPLSPCTLLDAFPRWSGLAPGQPRIRARTLSRRGSPTLNGGPPIRVRSHLGTYTVTFAEHIMARPPRAQQR